MQFLHCYASLKFIFFHESSHERSNNKIYCKLPLSRTIVMALYLAWGHLISWYKQMYDVLLSIAGNYYSKFNKFTIYF